MTIDTRLRDLAPDATLSADRVADIRADVLGRATAVEVRERPTTHMPRRRVLIGGVVAAATAGALVVGPTLIPNHDHFAPNALTPLAQAAENTPVPPLSGGRVLHRITEYRSVDKATGRVSTQRWDEWTLGDGTLYRQTTAGGKTTPFERWSPGAASDFTPEQVAALPTDPAGLLTALKNSRQAKTAGPGDPDEVQGLLATIIYGGYAPTKVWAAAIEAYGSFDDVHVRVDKAANRTYVTDIEKGGPLTLRFKSSTGQLLGYSSTSPEDGGSTETMTVRLSEIEHWVSARVSDNAVQSQ